MTGPRLNMSNIKMIDFLLLIIVLLQNEFVVGLTSYHSNDDIFDIVVHYDDLMPMTYDDLMPMSSPLIKPKDDFSLEVVSFVYLILYFEYTTLNLII